ncbi:MAG: hypothetical protein EOP92_12430 [Lysobacteraceae bacterium]|nr:MAG: hypothetical protein EOP92_12430 [Xanthomonadaceae bacterium]
MHVSRPCRIPILSVAGRFRRVLQEIHMACESDSHPTFRVLFLAVLAVLSCPAWAADAPCADGGGTNDGSESGYDNTTCNYTDSAFGFLNNAQGGLSSAVGANNTATGSGSSAFGSGNSAGGTDSSAFGSRNNVFRSGSSAFGSANRIEGTDSLAVGTGNILFYIYTNPGNGMLFSRLATAVGIANQVAGIDIIALGNSNTSLGQQSAAVGYGNYVMGDQSSAFGYRNNTSGPVAVIGASAFGNQNNPDVAAGENSNAFGYMNQATGKNSSAFGVQNVASAFGTSAIGFANTASGYDSSAIGWRNQTLGVQSVAMGRSNLVTLVASGASAMGQGNTANGIASTAIGFRSQTNARQGLAMGFYSQANGLGALASGRHALANGEFSVAVGNWTGAALGDPFLDLDLDGDGVFDADSRQTIAHGANASAFGPAALALSADSVAIGHGARSGVAGAVAIGANSFADRGNSVSFGSDTLQRQLIQVAAGTQGNDAVNLSQLQAVATALGSGASYAGGVFAAPTYRIQSNNFNDVGSAFAAVDSELTDINQRISNAGGIQGEQGLSAYEVAVSNGFAGTEGDWLQSLNGPQGPSGPTGPEGPAGGGPRSLTYDSDTRDVLTMAGADGTRIANVADGVEATDAVNLGQMEAGDAGTLSAANEYTDNTATETLSSANAYTDQRFAEITGLSDSFESFRNETDRRFQQQDRRIDKLSAMSGAYAGMAMNTSGLAGRNRIGVGVGAQGGEQALAVGYQRALGNRASVSIAGAFSGDEKSVSAGAGFSW